MHEIVEVNVITTKKQMDLIRQRNSELASKLDDLKIQAEFDKEINTENYQCVKDLVSDLEKIKIEWTKALDDLHKQQARYSYILSDLQNLYDSLQKFSKEK